MSTFTEFCRIVAEEFTDPAVIIKYSNTDGFTLAVKEQRADGNFYGMYIGATTMNDGQLVWQWGVHSENDPLREDYIWPAKTVS